MVRRADRRGQPSGRQLVAALLEAGEEATLAGTSVLRFDADGLVAEQWDAWHLIAGRCEPPDGWGR